MENYNLVDVSIIKLGVEAVGNKVDSSGKVLTVNLSFISTIELVGDGGNFSFYRRITMSDGRRFNVSV